MRKVMKLIGIGLTLVVVLAVLMTSVAMAAGPNEEHGDRTQSQTCSQNQDCTCDGNQTQTQTCTQSQDCTCISAQTQTQAQAGKASLTQTQNAGDLSSTQTQEGEPNKTRTKTRAGKV